MATSKVYKDSKNTAHTHQIHKATFQIHADEFTSIKCDQCKSVDIIETTQGYVCRTCGIVLPYQKLEYHRPYNKKLVQYETLRTTQLGTPRERLAHAHSVQFLRLNKLHSIRDNEKSVIEKAKIEASRLCTCLNLPKSLKASVMVRFKTIWSQLRPGTKYRSAYKLIPITIYYTCKLDNIVLKEQALLEVAKIGKKDFNEFKLKISKFLPEYRHRDRKEIVLRRLYGLIVTYERGMPFYYSCKKFLDKFWPIIKNTKDDVIAGLVASIIALIDTKYDKTRFSINTICTELGIKPSTIHFQVKNRIFKPYNLSEFDTLVKSRTVLREFLVKIGLIEENAIEDIKLDGTALQTFNYYDTDEYYFYILKDISDYPIFICLKPSQDKLICNASRLSQNNEFELVFWWFERPKGPPDR